MPKQITWCSNSLIFPERFEEGKHSYRKNIQEKRMVRVGWSMF